MLLSAPVRAILRFLTSSQCAGRASRNVIIILGFVVPLLVHRGIFLLITKTPMAPFSAKSGNEATILQQAIFIQAIKKVYEICVLQC